MGTSTVKLNGTTLLSIDDTTATASDVASGKYFYTADGTKTEGTASGGDDVADWARPANAPNLDEITLSSSEDVIYITYDIQYDDLNFCLFKFQGAYQVDIGTVNNGIFTAIEQSESVSSNTLYFKDLSSYKNNYDYIVIKITGTITKIEFYNHSYTDNITGRNYFSNTQPILEIYCSLPHLTSAGGSFRGLCTERYYIANFSPTDLENTFRDNINLKQVDKLNWDTSNLTKCSYMFYQDNLLRKFNAKGLVSNSTTTIAYLFYDCRSLQEVDTTDWDTKNVTKMNDAFRSCSNLKTIEVGNFDTKNVDSFGSMFRACFIIDNLDVSNWDMGSATDIQYMFFDCFNLHFLDVSKWDVKNITNYSYAFNTCYSLYSLDVSDWDTSSAINMQCMFATCKNLRMLDVSNFDMDSVTNINSMFVNNSSLRNIDISEWDLSSVTNSDNFMNGCLAPNSLIVPSTLPKIGTSTFNFMNNTLSEYHFLATTPPTLANTNGLKGSTPIYVPYSADHSVLNAYKTATNWSSFASYIQEEES